MDATPGVTLHYSEKLLRAALRTYFAHLLGGKFFFTMLFATCACLAYLFFQGWNGWMMNAILTVFLLLILLFMMTVFSHYRHSMGIFRSMKKPESVFEYCEDGFTVSSDLGSSTVPWRRIVGSIRRPDFWLLFLSPAQFITLPVADFSPKDLAFIDSKIGKKAP